MPDSDHRPVDSGHHRRTLVIFVGFRSCSSDHHYLILALVIEVKPHSQDSGHFCRIPVMFGCHHPQTSATVIGLRQSSPDFDHSYRTSSTFTELRSCSSLKNYSTSILKVFCRNNLLDIVLKENAEVQNYNVGIPKVFY